VKGAGVPAVLDLARRRAVADAFFAAARSDDFDALVAVLDPDVVLRIDAGAAHTAASMVVRGADAVARQALSGLAPALRAVQLHPVRVNGTAAVIVTRRGQPVTVIDFTVTDSKIAEINATSDPERVQKVAAAVLHGE
jgi:RNA polymerase sigma-70 factor (ECF subfamily)